MRYLENRYLLYSLLMKKVNNGLLIRKDGEISAPRFVFFSAQSNHCKYPICLGLCREQALPMTVPTKKAGLSASLEAFVVKLSFIFVSLFCG